MTADENKRIAHLTTGAIKTTTDNAIKAMVAAVEAAEAKTAEMRSALQEYVEEFEKVTSLLADNVSAHVASCQEAIDSFQAHHLKILNGDAQIPAPQTPKEEAEERVGRPLSSVNLDEELGKLRAMAPSPVDGRY